MTDRPTFTVSPARQRGRWMFVALLLVIGWQTVERGFPRAAAQTAPASPAASAPAPSPAIGDQMPTLLDLFMTSPYINGLILILSVLAVVVFAYLLLSLTAASFCPPRFIDDVTKLVLNRQFDQAIHLCQNHPDLFAAGVVQRVVENRDKEHGVLMEIVLSEGRRRAELIWNRVGYLAEISNVAPMLGLLGTVVGMIKVFFTLTTRTVGERASQLAEGVAEAMGTTMFGLVVAIGAAVLYTLIRGRAVVALAETEQACHTLADHIQRVAADPRLRRIDALAEAARAKLASAPPGAPQDQGSSSP